MDLCKCLFTTIFILFVVGKNWLLKYHGICSKCYEFMRIFVLTTFFEIDREKLLRPNFFLLLIYALAIVVFE
jgi:hypothetical protein